jgi:hypothetical protein
LVWDNSYNPRICSALATESAEPLPDPPYEAPELSAARKTITDYPELFKIVTPIKVNIFERLLRTHPNQPFVRSICKGLREGFWPWADTSDPLLPTSWDNSSLYPLDPNHESTIANDIQNELAADRYSPPFGPDLLPGMFSMPLFVIPKPHSVKCRVVFDHSAEPHSLNSLIPREKVLVTLDNMHDLGCAVNRARETNDSSIPLTLIKSDVSTAYRLMPVHPLWQIRQVVTFKGMRHVDRCNIWGNRAAGNIFCSFMGLVLWIAIKVKHLEDLFAYVDDAFSWDFEGNLEFYEPYEAFIPEKQCSLLLLWDELGIPHEKSKQIHGTSLRIIGFEVDVSAMTISMPAKALGELIEAVRAFAKPNKRRTLRDFQRIGGWINWALNVFPLLRPGLCTLYEKIRGKTHSRLPICVSVALCREFIWVANHMEHLPGVNMLSSRKWSAPDTSIHLFADACPAGLGFWFPKTNQGFQYATSTSDSDDIFFLEALAVVSALHWLVHTHLSWLETNKVVIFTDNENTVNIFNSLHASPTLNTILITSVDLILQFKIELRVLHVAGTTNNTADSLSRFQNARAVAHAPDLSISPFTPPQLSKGATLS